MFDNIFHIEAYTDHSSKIRFQSEKENKPWEFFLTITLQEKLLGAKFSRDWLLIPKYREIANSTLDEELYIHDDGYIHFQRAVLQGSKKDILCYCNKLHLSIKKYIVKMNGLFEDDQKMPDKDWINHFNNNKI